MMDPTDKQMRIVPPQRTSRVRTTGMFKRLGAVGCAWLAVCGLPETVSGQDSGPGGAMSSDAAERATLPFLRHACSPLVPHRLSTSTTINLQIRLLKAAQTTAFAKRLRCNLRMLPQCRHHRCLRAVFHCRRVPVCQHPLDPRLQWGRSTYRRQTFTTTLRCPVTAGTLAMAVLVRSVCRFHRPRPVRLRRSIPTSPSLRNPAAHSSRSHVRARLLANRFPVATMPRCRNLNWEINLRRWEIAATSPHPRATGPTES